MFNPKPLTVEELRVLRQRYDHSGDPKIFVMTVEEADRLWAYVEKMQAENGVLREALGDTKALWQIAAKELNAFDAERYIAPFMKVHEPIEMLESALSQPATKAYAERVEKMRQALEFYADEKSYKVVVEHGMEISPVMFDMGQRAYVALKEDKPNAD